MLNCDLNKMKKYTVVHLLLVLKILKKKYFLTQYNFIYVSKAILLYSTH